eukprot:GDKK01007986.1.p1 GENE.GDKK01007986.1~~GDKK01007986.1.p1  ORF type:complete len:301 (-),score=46.48 GDKK01007986.1:75-977(-)
MVTPVDFQMLTNGGARLSVILNEAGGVKDDCIVSKYADHSYVVINAGCKDKDIAHFKTQLEAFNGDVQMEVLDTKGLFALQGPKAMSVMSKFVPDLEKQAFMTGKLVNVAGQELRVTRCGYTGEDGFEVAIEGDNAVAFAEELMKNEVVKPIGLAARDSLRLEAGMCLYGHELGEDINPVTAGLMWLFSKRRMAEGGFIGHKAVVDFKANVADKCPTTRVGIISGGSVARENTEVFKDGKVIGKICSGCPSPTLGKNVAQAYVTRGTKSGEKVQLNVRGKLVDAEVAKMPFVETHYYRIN